jgi:hypothetical protein
VLVATLVATGGVTAALVFALSRVGGDESDTRHAEHPSASIEAPAATPSWLVRLAARKARELTNSAPTRVVIEKRRLTYEVRLYGDFTWLVCDPCPQRGPLPVAIRDSISFRVDPELRRIVMASGPRSLMG